MTLDQKTRDYRLFRPSDLDDSKPVPVVLVLHGAGGLSADRIAKVTRFDEAAVRARFMAVYPDGCYGSWDYRHLSYDVDFIRELLDRLDAQVKIDKSRVYVAGGSLGGAMSYRLACDLADRFAGVASVTGFMPFDDCQPTRPVSILEMHGTADRTVPNDGSELIRRWSERDHCVGAPAVSQNGITRTSRWDQCEGGLTVRHDAVIGGHHTWFGAGGPSAPNADPVVGEPDATTEVWSFFTSLRPAQ